MADQLVEQWIRAGRKNRPGVEIEIRVGGTWWPATPHSREAASQFLREQRAIFKVTRVGEHQYEVTHPRTLRRLWEILVKPEVIEPKPTHAELIDAYWADQHPDSAH